MNCASCNHANPEGARFCNGCGAALEARCRRCNTQNPPGARFCNGCGSALGTPASPPVAPVPVDAPAPHAYTPKHLADRILATRSAMEGERKQVTILFADVKGSMQLAEQLDPEQWHQILDRFFAILTEGVHRFEGTVNQYTGDGIMALFGAPLALEDHAERACYAALLLQEKLREFGQQLRREQGLDFTTRIGLNSGEVIVGKIGDDLRMDYTAQGHTVGLAQRMEQLAEAGAIYLGPDTARLVGEVFTLESLGDFVIRGSAAPVPVHALRAAGGGISRFEVSRRRGLSHFVGREREMQRLGSALAAARQGHGSVVHISAPAGTGKSRLCFEFTQKAAQEGAVVHVAQALSHGRFLPHGPILAVLRSLFGLTAGMSREAQRERIAGRMALLDEQLSRRLNELLPTVLSFLGVGGEGAALPDAQTRQAQLMAVAQRLLQQAASASPVIVLLEDLHWLDAGSEAWLVDWIKFAPRMPLLLVCNARPEYGAAWLGMPQAEKLVLAPLDDTALSTMVHHLLGHDASVRALVPRLLKKAGGNPFFLEEIVRALVDEGALTGAVGDRRLVRPSATLDVPATVQALLAARMDRLGAPAKRVLSTAAVLGREFTRKLLEAVVDETLAAGPVLDAALGELVAAGLLDEEALYPEARYVFRHPLMQEVGYAAQLSTTRAAAHLRAAGVLESQVPASSNSAAALIAYHWDRGGEALRASRWHYRAAIHVTPFWSDLGFHLLRANELLALLDVSEERDRLWLRVLLDMMFVQNVSRIFEDSQVTRGKADAHVLEARLGDRHALAALHTHATMLAWFSGAEMLEDPEAAAMELLELAAGFSPQERLFAFDPQLAAAEILRGLGRSAAYLEVSLDRDYLDAAARVFNDAEDSVFIRNAGLTALGNLVRPLIELGELARARQLFVENPPPANGLKRHFELVQAAQVEVYAGNTALAGALLDALKPDAMTYADVPFSRLAFLELLVNARDRDLLLRVMEVVEQNMRPGSHPYQFVLLGLIARGHWCLGNKTGALERAVACFEDPSPRIFRWGRLHAAHAFAEICILNGDRDDPRVEAALDEMESIAGGYQGPGYFLAPAKELRARRALLRGNTAEAIRFLSEARDLFAGFDADGHVRRLDEELVDLEAQSRG